MAAVATGCRRRAGASQPPRARRSPAIIVARMTMPVEVALPDAAPRSPERTALEDGDRRLTYAELDRATAAVASTLLGGRADLAEARVAFLVPPSIDYVLVQRGVWRAGGVAVPLCASHPPPELDYVLADAQPELVVASPDLADRLRPLAAARGIELRLTTDVVASLRGRGAQPLPRLDARAPRDDRLHQRHHRRAQGRGDDARRPARADGEPDRGVGMDPATIASCSRCRSITCTASSTCSVARSLRAPPASCTRPSTRRACGSPSPATASRCSWRCRRSTSVSSRRGTRRTRSAAAAWSTAAARTAAHGVGLGGAARDACSLAGARSPGTSCSSATA